MKNNFNRITGSLKRISLIGAMLALGSTAISAQAGVSLNVDVGVPPPAPQVEAVPAVPAGYVWAPGYWDYVHGQYVWRRGHLMEGRPGYRWAPESWERRGDVHHFNEGHWERDPHWHR